MSDQKTYIIIGSSAAGVGALLKLRQLDSYARIMCISAESYFPYNKCLLADYVSGSLLQDQLFLLTEQRIQELKIDLILNTRVISIDRYKKTVVTDSDQEFAYDALLLALGSSPWIPEITGIHGNGVFTFHTLADIEHIFKFCDEKKVKNIAVIGGGITGLECADALHKREKKVSIIERSIRLLSHCMPQEQSEHLAQVIQTCGAELYLNSQVAQIEHSHGSVSGVQMTDGNSIAAQLVIIATGVKGNVELAQQAGLIVGKHGLIVDEFFSTSDPAIFAAGDMIETKDQLNRHTIATRLWPDAMNQGMRAAMSMAGNPKPYNGVIPLIKSHFFDEDYLSLGWNNLGADKVIIFEKNTYTSAVQVFGGTITGISVIGKGFDIGLSRQAVLTAITVDEYRAMIS